MALLTILVVAVSMIIYVYGELIANRVFKNEFVMRLITVFSCGICLFREMRQSPSLRNVRNTLILRKKAMFCTIQINAPIMQSMFLCLKKSQLKGLFRSKQSDW